MVGWNKLDNGMGFNILGYNRGLNNPKVKYTMQN
jgi:hypothetical protein